MSVNISSPSNSSLPDSVIFDCFDSTVTLAINITFTITRALLLLPLSTLVLYLGHQRWRQQRSFTTTSHSDIFTYHLAVMELMWCLGSAFYYIGSCAYLLEIKIVGTWLSSITYYGEGLFHLLTCVERYLAVVHPITYLGLKKAGGVRIRNISIGCVWLLSLGWGVITAWHDPHQYRSLIFYPLVFPLVVCSFCSLSVLRVLIRPGPGEVGGYRERVDQSKQRAFYTIMAITGVLGFWFVGLLVVIVLDALPLQVNSFGCVVKICASWSNMPSSVVLPLLYLNKARKLSTCCHISR